jgi:Na+-transporting NADH:ubiquinone oxidoreductase subunit C
LLKGYFAVQKDGHTVAGITFYEQKETPGLGAEIDQKWFTDNYKGKNILNNKGELVSVKVAKGKVSEQPADVQQNMVDGISGATMTTRGVNDLLLAGLKSYRPYFEKIWAQSGPTN